MNTFQEVLTVLATAVSLLAGLFTFLIKFIKNEKVKRALQQTLKIMEVLQPMIIQAEEFTHYTGNEKKQFVLTRANQYALENKMKFDSDKYSSLIDEIVETTKKVNMRIKDKDLRDKSAQVKNLDKAPNVI